MPVLQIKPSVIGNNFVEMDFKIHPLCISNFSIKLLMKQKERLLEYSRINSTVVILFFLQLTVNRFID